MDRRTRHLAFGERIGLIVFLAGLAMLLAHNDWLWRLDRLIYDAELRLWSRPAPDDIVIVAVDEASLAQFGRWPWPRELHAALLNRLTEESPRAIVLDFIFAEPDTTDPRGDQALAQAIESNGRVVLPVLMEQSRVGGQPVETLPLPSLADAAAGLGHVHVELDADGIARSFFLYEGLGNAFWPHISLASLTVGETAAYPPPTPQSAVSPMLWTRDQARLIPYAGPPGHFKRISYAQVIDGAYQADTFRHRYVLVGTTVVGVGDALPTPVSGHSRSMPGVEINANILDAIRNNINITPLSHAWRVALSGLIAVLPILLFPFLAPRSTLLAAALLIVLTFALTGALLWFAHLWFPPAAALAALTLSYPLWSWRRLEHAMRYLNHELDALTRQRTELAIDKEVALTPALEFLARLLPIAGWSVYDIHGTQLTAGRSAPPYPTQPVSTSNWTLTSAGFWRRIERPSGPVLIGINWQGKALPSGNEHALFDELAHSLTAQEINQTTSFEVLQARIGQIQDVTRQLQELRSFVDDSLANMSDGVIVANVLGQILIANPRAGWYLCADDGAQLRGRSLYELLDGMLIREGGSWDRLLQTALLEQTRSQVTVRHKNDRDLLIQIAPLSDTPCQPRGLVLNFSDISPLTASERKRDELLSFLSHDLRSPLVSVLALLELTKKKNSLAEIHTQLDRMTGYTEKTLNLAEQFLQLARAEGNQDLAFYDVDLINLLMNAREQVWAQAQAREIEIHDAIEPQEAWVTGDGNLLERALVNLLTNAIKYSPPGSQITLSLTHEQAYFRCCIKDQGLGIPAQDLPRLFDRFQRVHRRNSRDQDGAGLGLAFVDAVIRRHRGQIEVQSVEGEGSCFCLLLTAAGDSQPSSN